MFLHVGWLPPEQLQPPKQWPAMQPGWSGCVTATEQELGKQRGYPSRDSLTATQLQLWLLEQPRSATWPHQVDHVAATEQEPGLW